MPEDGDSAGGGSSSSGDPDGDTHFDIATGKEGGSDGDGGSTSSSSYHPRSDSGAETDGTAASSPEGGGPGPSSRMKSEQVKRRISAQGTPKRVASGKSSRSRSSSSSSSSSSYSGISPQQALLNLTKASAQASDAYTESPSEGEGGTPDDTPDGVSGSPASPTPEAESDDPTAAAAAAGASPAPASPAAAASAEPAAGAESGGQEGVASGGATPGTPTPPGTTEGSGAAAAAGQSAGESPPRSPAPPPPGVGVVRRSSSGGSGGSSVSPLSFAPDKQRQGSDSSGDDDGCSSGTEVAHGMSLNGIEDDGDDDDGEDGEAADDERDSCSEGCGTSGVPGETAPTPQQGSQPPNQAKPCRAKKKKKKKKKCQPIVLYSHAERNVFTRLYPEIFSASSEALRKLIKPSKLDPVGAGGCGVWTPPEPQPPKAKPARALYDGPRFVPRPPPSSPQRSLRGGATSRGGVVFANNVPESPTKGACQTRGGKGGGTAAKQGQCMSLVPRGGGGGGGGGGALLPRPPQGSLFHALVPCCEVLTPSHASKPSLVGHHAAVREMQLRNPKQADPGGGGGGKKKRRGVKLPKVKPSCRHLGVPTVMLLSQDALRLRVLKLQDDKQVLQKRVLELENRTG